MKILVVEDNPDYAHLLEVMLTPYGETTIAEDGVTALSALQSAWDKGLPFDLICLDIMLPKMSGLELLRIIRQTEEKLNLGGCLGAKVVMLTAREDDEAVLEAIQIGCEGYVFKTAGKRKLIAKLEELGFSPKQ